MMTNQVPITNSKRIAKNTLLLYVRMLLSMAINLYTSKIVLNTLGVVDFGTYNIVSGTVLLLSFLNSTLSGSTSRFLNFERTNKEKDHLKKVFSASLTIHIIVALIFLLISELIGPWLLNKYLVIPYNRLHAAGIVYQTAIFVGTIQLLQVPFTACIISNEKMNVYAYVSFLEVSLKLCVAYTIVFLNFDKLIIYGMSILTINILVGGTYIIYSLKSFKECILKLNFEKKIISPILSFSLWDYRVTCVL